MKYVLAAFLLLFPVSTVHGQFNPNVTAISGYYHGSSEYGYQCELKIDSDATVLFMYSVDHNQAYAEERGKISQANDSVFFLDLQMTFGQFIEEAGQEDSLYLDSQSFGRLGWPQVQVTYSSGVKETFDPQSGDMFPLNKKLIRKKKSITIDIGHTHPLTGKPVTFQIVYGSAPDFVWGDKHHYALTIKNGTAVTFGAAPMQTGKFFLRKAK